MRSKQRFCEAAGLEKREAQEDRVAHAAPNSAGNIVAAQRNALHQYCVDPHTDHNEKRLEAQGQQGAEIILPHHALLPISEGGKRNWGQAGHQVDFDHSAVDDYEDQNTQDFGGQLNHHTLQEQRKERPDLHGLQSILHGCKCSCVHRCISGNESAGAVDHMLCHIKNSHHNVEGVGDEGHGNKGLENPFEENPGFKVGKVIVFNDHLNQLVAGDECQDQACNGDNH